MQDKSASLPKNVLAVIRDKGTERPFTGEYDEFSGVGSYLCRRCGLALFRSKDKFHSGCGWPSFDKEISGAVDRKVDQDGRRTEILCHRCGGHLGHVFMGERMTEKNQRHCVNSLSLDYVTDLNILDTQEAIFAAGCFWGVEYYFKRLPGVLKTEVGYSGGKVEYPTYDDICKGKTEHFEVIRVIYDPMQITYAQLARFFFEIHDASQADGQGPDKGHQYLSVGFYYDDAQKQTLEYLIERLKTMGYSIATKVLPVSPYWRAETYHQDYYEKTGKLPYCHRYEKKFID